MGSDTTVQPHRKPEAPQMDSHLHMRRTSDLFMKVRLRLRLCVHVLYIYIYIFSITLTYFYATPDFLTLYQHYCKIPCTLCHLWIQKDILSLSLLNIIYKRKLKKCEVIKSSIAVQSWCRVNFCLCAAWQEVEQKLGDGTGGELTNRQRPIQYTEKTPSAPIKSQYFLLLLYDCHFLFML